MIGELVRRVVALERRVNGLVLPERPRWIDWTPTVNQGGAVAVTVTVARYMVLGDLAVVQARLDVTGAGVAASHIVIAGQPAAIQSANAADAMMLGGAWVYDNGAALYVGALVTMAATDWRIICHNEVDFCGVDPSFALTAGDAILLQAAYERA